MRGRERHYARRAACVVLCAMAFGCGGAAQPEPDAGDADSSAAVDVPLTTVAPAVSERAVPQSCEDLHTAILKVRPTRQAFAAAFGAPDSIAPGAEPNRHDPAVTDSIFTVYYPGLVLDIRTPAGSRDMATHVRVEDNRYLAYPGIGIGAAATKVEEVLGEPHERRPGRLTYQCDQAVEQPVTFSLPDGRVRAIEIAYYVD